MSRRQPVAPMAHLVHPGLELLATAALCSTKPPTISDLQDLARLRPELLQVNAGNSRQLPGVGQVLLQAHLSCSGTTQVAPGWEGRDSPDKQEILTARRPRINVQDDQDVSPTETICACSAGRRAGLARQRATKLILVCSNVCGRPSCLSMTAGYVTRPATAVPRLGAFQPTPSSRGRRGARGQGCILHRLEEACGYATTATISSTEMKRATTLLALNPQGHLAQ